MAEQFNARVVFFFSQGNLVSLNHGILVSFLLQNFYVKATIQFLLELHVVVFVVIFNLKDISDPDRQMED